MMTDDMMINPRLRTVADRQKAKKDEMKEKL